MTTEEQRADHTARTIEAVGVIKDAFREIERLKLQVNGLELENQRLRNAALMARSLSNG